MKRVALLGATGSIGTNCLDVIRAHPDRLSLHAASAHRNWRGLADSTRPFSPRQLIISDEAMRNSIERTVFATDCELRFGAAEIEQMAADPDVDIVVSAIVGAAGLPGTWAAVEAGKTIAIANKETLVMAGPQVMRRATEAGAKLIPVDSEHSAIFQCLQAGRQSDVRRIVLTASGGPFRGRSRSELEQVTVEAALDHPTWNMGPKITIDSATMMNKALEVIEARWLFDIPVERIEVVVHPQSVLHSFVEFADGSVIAQLSPPDMRLPIQYALTYPERLEGVSPRIDWTQVCRLDWEPPDWDAFPALELGFEAARRGGTAGAVLNAANETAVERFLAGDLAFVDIPRACGAVMEAHEFDPSPTLSDLRRLDGWARKEILRWKS